MNNIIYTRIKECHWAEINSDDIPIFDGQDVTRKFLQVIEKNKTFREVDSSDFSCEQMKKYLRKEISYTDVESLIVWLNYNVYINAPLQLILENICELWMPSSDDVAIFFSDIIVYINHEEEILMYKVGKDDLSTLSLSNDIT